MCRRWSGGPVLAAAVFGFEMQGEHNVVRYDSSEWAQRGFCGKCGTNLFYFAKAAHQYLVCVGAFDEPAAFELVKEIYVDHRPPGYEFAGDLQQRTEGQVLAEFGLSEG